MISENQRLSKDFKKNNFLSGTYLDDPQDDFNQITGNLQCQIQLLTEENKNLDSIWKLSKLTIQELEREISEYRQLLNQPNSIVEVEFCRI